MSWWLVRVEIALGHPYQDLLSIGQIVAWKLQGRTPERKVVADVLAREGATLEEMHQKLAGIKHRPDVVIIFSGHNEFQARFPVGPKRRATERPVTVCV